MKLSIQEQYERFLKNNNKTVPIKTEPKPQAVESKRQEPTPGATASKPLEAEQPNFDLSFLDIFDTWPKIGALYQGCKHIVFDCEVFKKYWLVVALVLEERRFYWFDNREAFTNFVKDHKTDIWIGYNNRCYDNYIIKLILIGARTQTVKNANDFIITGQYEDGTQDEKHSGNRFIWICERENPGIKARFDSIQLITFDIMNTFANPPRLKQLEGYTGESIVESSIPFNYDGELSNDQRLEVLRYCLNDVKATAEIFTRPNGKKEPVKLVAMQAQQQLIIDFGLNASDLICTEQQLACKTLEAKRPERERRDAFALSYPQFANEPENLTMINWYNNPKNQTKDERQPCKIIAADTEITCGWGGIHGARKNYIDKGEFWHVDVKSYYPNLILNNGFLSRNVANKDKFKEIVDKRLEAKARGDKITASALKIVINGTNGAMKAQFSDLYDPRQYNHVVAWGQLLLVKLVKMLAGKCEMLNINTDGLIIRITDTPIEALEPILKQWESATGLELERDKFVEMYQKDVNNYLVIDDKGNQDGKGDIFLANIFKSDLEIVNLAVKLYLLDGKPLADTINGCNDLMMFQRIITTSKKFDGAIHKGQKLKQEVNRVFASNRANDGGVYRTKGERLAKFDDTPESAFICNDKVKGEPIPQYLDKNWYIDLAQRRLNLMLGVRNKARKKTTAATIKQEQLPNLC